MAEALNAKADTNTATGRVMLVSASMAPLPLPATVNRFQVCTGEGGAQRLTPEEPELKTGGVERPGATVTALGAFSKHISRGFLQVWFWAF